MTTIRPYLPADWPDVQRIYADGIATKVATFEATPKPQNQWESESVSGSAIVAEIPGSESLAGWAILWPVSDRCAYAGVAEVSVYVGSNARGAGVGKALLKELVTISEQLDIWTLQAGIFEENLPSIRLHEKCGFRIVGVRERLGALDGIWKNIVLMERRSSVAGT